MRHTKQMRRALVAAAVGRRLPAAVRMPRTLGRSAGGGRHAERAAAKARGRCFYPPPVDSITIARYAKVGQVEEVLARAGMKSDWPAEPEDTGRVLIHVSVGVGAEERAAELVRDAGLLGRQRLAPVSANAATSGPGGPGPGRRPITGRGGGGDRSAGGGFIPRTRRRRACRSRRPKLCV